MVGLQILGYIDHVMTGSLRRLIIERRIRRRSIEMFSYILYKEKDVHEEEYRVSFGIIMYARLEPIFTTTVHNCQNVITVISHQSLEQRAA